MKYSDKRRKCEMSYGRWKLYASTDNMPWQFSLGCQRFMDEMCSKAKGRSDWGKMVMIFEKMKSMKIAHNLFFFFLSNSNFIEIKGLTKIATHQERQTVGRGELKPLRRRATGE